MFSLQWQDLIVEPVEIFASWKEDKLFTLFHTKGEYAAGIEKEFVQLFNIMNRCYDKQDLPSVREIKLELLDKAVSEQRIKQMILDGYNPIEMDTKPHKVEIFRNCCPISMNLGHLNYSSDPSCDIEFLWKVEHEQN